MGALSKHNDEVYPKETNLKEEGNKILGHRD